MIDDIAFCVVCRLSFHLPATDFEVYSTHSEKGVTPEHSLAMLAMVVKLLRVLKKSGTRKRAVLLTISCGILRSSIFSLPTFAENARSPRKSRFIVIAGRFRLENFPRPWPVGTKMAITRSRGPKTRSTSDHGLRDFALFDFVHCKIC